MSNQKQKRLLAKKRYRINQVSLASQTSIAGDILNLKQDVCADAILHAGSGIVLDATMKIITPARYNEYTDTILDVQPLAVKEKGCALGEGTTRTLTGVVLMLCGKDESDEQISEAGSSEGVLSDKVRFNRPGSVDNDEIIIKIDCTIKAGERMKRKGPLSCHKVADYISEEIRQTILELDDEQFAAHAVEEETFIHTRHTDKPKILLVKEIMGQGAMHEKLILPIQPCGIIGARSNIDMGNIPIMLSPLEAVDGGVHALTCVGPSTKETSRHYFRDPLVNLALADGDIDLCGVAFVGSPDVSQQKYMVAERLGMLAEAIDAEGVIVATEGYGNNHIDFAAHLEAVGKRGIPVVGVTFSGNFGPLIAGNRFTTHLVDCAKSTTGLENNILADNTTISEDGETALAMLKSLLSGESVSEPPRGWDVGVRKKNLYQMKTGIHKGFQSEVPTSIMPPMIWTPVEKPLDKMKIAIVSGTGVHVKQDQRFTLSSDSSFRIIPGNVATADLTVSHGGYDNTDALLDINSMFPLDRLRELALDGVIAHVAPRHIGFMGGGGDLKALAGETGPAIAHLLKNDGVDAVVLTAG